MGPEAKLLLIPLKELYLGIPSGILCTGVGEFENLIGGNVLPFSVPPGPWILCLGVL